MSTKAVLDWSRADVDACIDSIGRAHTQATVLEALIPIVRRYGGPLGDDVWDALQDKLESTLDEFLGTGSLASYFRVVIWRLVVDCRRRDQRKVKREVALDSPTVRSELPDRRPSAEDALLLAERDSEVRVRNALATRCVDALRERNPGQFETLALSIRHPHAEVARILGITVSLVGVRRFRALSFLRKCVDDGGPA